MKVEQRILDAGNRWETRSGNLDGLPPQLVFVFGGRALLEEPRPFEAVRHTWPDAHVVIASTSGEITGTEVTEDRVTAVAVALEHTRVACAAVTVHRPTESFAAGRELADGLRAPELVHVFAVSDGSQVNGAALARGFNLHLPPGVRLTGGLAGDGTRFEKTLVGLDEPPITGRIVAVGFYGRHLHVGFGSSGGWSPFGPERIVTRSDGNILYELDGHSALRLYRNYLGDQAAALPGSALRFPLFVTPRDGGPNVIRTILSIDDAAQSMVFAGDIPEGARVRLGRASYEDLIDGAVSAAEQSLLLPEAKPDLAICVSCVGRRIVLGQRIEEETEGVRDVLGPRPVLTGFYSYGELAPNACDTGCQLHNQTMTITTLREDR